MTAWILIYLAGGLVFTLCAMGVHWFTGEDFYVRDLPKALLAMISWPIILGILLVIALHYFFDSNSVLLEGRRKNKEDNE